MKNNHRVLMMGPIHYWSDALDESAGEALAFPRWQAQAGWVRALRLLGYEVTTFFYSDNLAMQAARRILGDSLLSSFVGTKLGRYGAGLSSEKSWDRGWRSRQLMKRAVEKNPDIICVSGGPGLRVLGDNSIRNLRARFPQAKLLLFNGMKPDYPEVTLERELAPLFDAVITNDHTFAQTWRGWGAQKVLAPVSAVDPELWLESPLQTSDAALSSEVVFIGTIDSVHRDRLERLESIADLNLDIYGPSPNPFSKHPKLAQRFRGPARGPRQIEIYRSAKIGLNFHGLNYMPEGANLRTFEIPATGCLQMVDRIMPGLYEPQKEIVVFGDGPELREKLSYYLTHETERKAIARAGFERTRRDHTYVQRFGRLFKDLGLEL